jgi:hypothetical protein
VSRGTRSASVQFYVDADVLGLAKILVQVRPDVTFPGDRGGTLHRQYRPPCPIESTEVPDPEWIPEVTRRGWLIITRDSRISRSPREIMVVRESGARMVALAGREARGTWEQLEILLCRWRDVAPLLELPGPFIYSATRASLRAVDLAGN